jgi:hypothetical protein
MKLFEQFIFLLIQGCKLRHTMKTILYFLFFTFFLVTGGFGQSRFGNGSCVILNSGDTLYGKINDKEQHFDNVVLSKIEIVDSAGKKHIFMPDEIKGYLSRGNTYVTLDVNDKPGKKPTILVCKVITTGYCTLYEHRSKLVGYANGMMTESIIQYYYLQKKDEPLYRLNFNRLKIGKDLYFIDNGPLTYDIQNKYKKYEIEAIVRRYNSERLKSEAIKAQEEASQ